MEGPVRLNVGCGEKLWKGFINVDQPDNWSGIQPDVASDLRKLPFPEDYADELHAVHVIEHFSRNETEKVLMEWKRVLKPGGLLVLECPCLDKIAQNLYELSQLNKPDNLTLWASKTVIGLYGEYWRGGGMQHLWCFSAHELKGILTTMDFTDIHMLEPHYHRTDRDMRVEARK